MKRIYYFLKSYKFDIFAGIFTVIGFFLSKWVFFSILIIAISVLSVIYLRFREKEFYFIPMSRRNDRKDWIGSDVFEYSQTHNAFYLTSGELGVILERVLSWRNYRFTFDFKISNKCIGVIGRATNLSNYVMLQITETGVRPHLRISGGWKAWEAEDSNLEFEKKLSLDFWYKAQITFEDKMISIKILLNKEIIMNRTWTIPSGHVALAFSDKPDDEPLYIPFPINCEYGSVGFREYGLEKAFVRNVLIEKI